MLLQSSKGMRDVEITNGARERSPKYKGLRVDMYVESRGNQVQGVPCCCCVGVTDGKASENTRKLSREGEEAVTQDNDRHAPYSVASLFADITRRPRGGMHSYDCVRGA